MIHLHFFFCLKLRSSPFAFAVCFSNNVSFANPVVVLSSTASASSETRERSLHVSPLVFRFRSCYLSPLLFLLLSTAPKGSLQGRHLSSKQLGGSRDCSSAEVFPPSRQEESIAEDELIPVEEEGEERTRSEVERQSEMNEEEEGEWQRQESGSDSIERMDRETRVEMAERQTPDNDQIMERYLDQVESYEEEEEQSERNEDEMREEGEKDCVLLNGAIEVTEEREDSDGDREEKEETERFGSSLEEKDDEADEGRREGERSLKHAEEDEKNNIESKVAKMSESKDEAIKQSESAKETEGMPAKKRLSRCERLPSEVRSVTFDPCVFLFIHLCFLHSIFSLSAFFQII